MRMLIWILAAGIALSSSASNLFSEDIEKSFVLAKKNKKPLIINFYGIWCPPCNEMKETVYVSPAFIQKSKSFVLLQVDADKKESWKIKDRYKVGGYPTILFTNSLGEEIYRVVGYRSPEEFSKSMDLVLASKGRPAAKACSSKSTDDLWRCAQSCMEKKDHACATKAFHSLASQLKPRTPRYEIMRSYLADHSENVDLKVKAFEGLLQDYPDSPYSVIWALSYWEAVQEQKVTTPKKELLEKVLQEYPKMKTDLRLEALGLTPTDLAQLRAEILGRLEKKEEAKAAWKEAAELLKKTAAELPAGVTDRGFMIEQITCLDLAGETDMALNLASQYQAKFPNEFTFHYIAASILEKKKRYNEALPIAQKSYDTSYGDNRIRAAILLIKLYGTASNKDAARKVYVDIKKEIAPETKLEVRTHRYLKQLDEVWGRIEKS